MNREIVNGLLVKLGVENAAALADDRADKKLKKRLGEGKFPTDLTDDEKALIEGMGFTPKAATPAATTETTETTATTATNEDGPKPYRLKGLSSPDGDRVEMITAAKADFRNKQRTQTNKDETRFWEPATDVDPATKVTPAASATKTTSAPKKKTAPKGGKTAPAPKGKTAPAPKGGKTAPAPKTKKAPAPKAASKREGPSKADAFRAEFSTKNWVNKAELVKRLEKAGCKPATTSSYIVWAKRDTQGTPNHANPWAFVIEEGKDKDGNKQLRRVRNFDVK